MVRGFVNDDSNDELWYAKNPEMLKCADIGFNTVTGLTTNSQGVAAPGVAVFNWVPSIGADNTAVNQAKDSKYSFVVHANSRAQTYDGSDLMITILAGKEVFCEIAELIRAYGIMQKYDQRNRYLPNALLSAAGFDPTDLRANYSHMLWDINNLIAQASQIWVPDDMPLFKREFWMCSHVYMDSESVKGQYYMYNKAVAFKYSATGDPNGSSLQMLSSSKACNQQLTWSQAVGRVQEMINALIVQQDRGLMFGDILKAYGADRIYKLNMISADYSIEPKYEPEVLSQMSNLHVSNTFPKEVIQSAGLLIENWTNVPNPTVTDLRPTEAVLNLHVAGQPTPGAVMVATRMMCLGNNFIVANNAFVQSKPRTSGTEVCFSYSICVYVNSAIKWNTYNTQILSSATSMSDALTRMFLTQSFDWFPPMYNTIAGGSTVPTPASPTANLHPYQFIMDMENYIWLDVLTLERIHTTALLSLFGVPVDM